MGNFILPLALYVGVSIWGGFVLTEEEVIRSRYAVITLAPFLAVSVVLPFILGAPGLLTNPLKLFVLLDAMASSVDMLNLLLIMKQVPNNAVLKNNGPKPIGKLQKLICASIFIESYIVKLDDATELACP